MKKILLVGIAAIGLLLAFSEPMRADSATLFINGGGGDPNLVNGPSFVVLQNSGGASVGTITNLVVLFSVPNVTSPGTGGISITSVSFGSAGSISLVGILATSPSCNGTSAGKDVYSCAGISNTNQSNSLANFNPAELAHNGFTASTYGIYQLVITGANLDAKGSITITGNFPTGTFIDAYGVSTTGKAFSTPFTEAGLVVPEPGTLALFGTGLVGIAGLLRRRLK